MKQSILVSVYIERDLSNSMQSNPVGKLCIEFGATHRKHNLTHKYLDLKINLSELLQILCETYAPP